MQGLIIACRSRWSKAAGTAGQVVAVGVVGGLG